MAARLERPDVHDRGLQAFRVPLADGAAGRPGPTAPAPGYRDRPPERCQLVPGRQRLAAVHIRPLKPQAAATLNHYVPDFGGSHDLKVGYEFQIDSSRFSANANSGPVRYLDDSANGRPFNVDRINGTTFLDVVSLHVRGEPESPAATSPSQNIGATSFELARISTTA